MHRASAIAKCSTCIHCAKIYSYTSGHTKQTWKDALRPERVVLGAKSSGLSFPSFLLVYHVNLHIIRE